MKIASFNINNINRRLENLLSWLREAEPDVVCLQELKAADTEFPADAIQQAGYHAVWHGEKRWNGVAILARWAPVMTRTDLPRDVADGQCRFLEAAVNGVLIASIYAPNGNPQPGPKFDYKLAWLERLNAHGENSTRLERRWRWRETTTLCRQIWISIRRSLGITTPYCSHRAAPRIGAFSSKAGPRPFARSIPKNRCTRFGITCGTVGIFVEGPRPRPAPAACGRFSSARPARPA
jgi:Endonuclease/Exonuclease/phosphatase family